jgi:hypothetical protein
MSERHYFNSEAITSIEWKGDDNDQSSEVDVTFARSRATYTTAAMPRYVFDAWKDAGSAGGFWHASVKGIYT